MCVCVLCSYKAWHMEAWECTGSLETESQMVVNAKYVGNKIWILQKKCLYCYPLNHLGSPLSRFVKSEKELPSWCSFKGVNFCSHTYQFLFSKFLHLDTFRYVMKINFIWLPPCICLISSAFKYLSVYPQIAEHSHHRSFFLQ